MNVDLWFVIIFLLVLVEYFIFIDKTTSRSIRLIMFILTTIQPSSSSSPYNHSLIHRHHLSSINRYSKHRSDLHLVYTFNLTNDSFRMDGTLPTERSLTINFPSEYNTIKDGSVFTRTQIKVILTAVAIVGFIILIIAIFRFKNACRDQETHNLQAEISRRRASQYSEPSSRRGSVGYYTRKYSRTPSIHLDNQLNISLPSKPTIVSVCDRSNKPTTTAAVVLSSSSPIQTTTTTAATPHHYHHVTSSSCDTSNITKQHLSITSPIVPHSSKSIVRKSCSTIGISRCDDQTPLLTSELASTIAASSNRSTRKYSLNAFLPIVRPSISHPLSSSSLTGTSTIAVAGGKTIDLKTRRRVSLSSALRRSSFAKQPQTFCSTIDSTTTTSKTSSSSPPPPRPPPTFLSSSQEQNQSGTADSDSSDRTSLLSNSATNSKRQYRKKSSGTLTTTTIPPLSYQRDFMQKIERFRFIDDSASSTTTVTSPVESVDRVNGHHYQQQQQQPCSHLITSAIEQFDDYIRARYGHDNEIESYIDRLNSETLTDGSYSDLNILNNTLMKPMQRPQTIVNGRQQQQQQQIFKPVNEISLKLASTDTQQQQQNGHRQSSIPIAIPHSATTSLTFPYYYQQQTRNSTEIPHGYPSDVSIPRPSSIITTNGHSRSMDFQTSSNKRDLFRPLTTTTTTPATIYESSSSAATLSSLRSSNSLEFDDNTKPSGVLVDDDFLPMSSPVDDHFWDMTPISSRTNPNRECFPNVGSSPDVEIKRFDMSHLSMRTSSFDQPFSETSCDEDDDNDEKTFSIHEYKMKELQKPLVVHRSVTKTNENTSSPIRRISGQANIVENTSPSITLLESTMHRLSFDRPSGESLLDKFTASNFGSGEQLPIRSPPLPISSRSPAASDFLGDMTLTSQPQTIYEEDDTQESETNDDDDGEESADNGEIDLVREFQLSQQQEQQQTGNNLWSTTDRDVCVIQEDDLLSAVVSTPPTNRPPPPSIMKVVNNRSIDSIDEPQQQQGGQSQSSNSPIVTLKPKVRFNLDPQYEREREWNKVNKLLGNSVEWTDEFEV